MIWGNDKQYSKEFQMHARKKAEEFAKKVEEDQKRYEEKQKNSKIGSSIKQWEQEQRAQGKIVNPLIQQHLDAKISEARWELAIGMALTLLIKGQWAIWIILIIFYNVHVSKLKKEALEYDLKNDKTLK